MITNNRNNDKKSHVPKKCNYCTNHKLAVDYKDITSLRRFVSSYMKIAPRRRSGLCARHQRQVANAIKRARQAALMPITAK
ncbi:MAG: 30S ribosomal protein S18 [Candidatus Magasanikbacteria bacterium RIFOXYC2_FULL_42_28]|uniref:Small ribosomal subunit protein bS18 n=1 Tax=Candidatus Magasanikbacteria bacterium RIFOXYC2_FULL_42_28 TaxID=1798704 RepID=A0A1F6NV46_9BACT|nr:MAG: 30S ribosomal protein S18 [Candidatus Magasanikbacteria bacterium RIFOXYC2_FULL_42_28]